MRVFAHYDNKGTIGGLVVVRGDGADGAITPPLPVPAPGLNVAELDKAGIEKIGRAIKKGDREELRQLCEGHVVAVKSIEQATLKKRKGA
jgi:hypothetical protein